MSSKNKMDTNTDQIQTPFILDSIIGYNPKVPIINLTTQQTEPKIALATGHIVTIYNIRPSTFEHLISHENEIISVICDSSARFIVTADSAACTVWDLQHSPPYAIRQFGIDNVQETFVQIAFSHDAKYLILCSSNKLQIWVWSANRNTPDAEIDLPTNEFGQLKSIDFNVNATNQFVVTMNIGLFFCEFSARSLETYKLSLPGIDFLKSIFVSDTENGLTINSQGFCTIWYAKMHLEEMSSEHFKIIKTVPLSKNPLVTINCIDNIIVVTDDNGNMHFFDKDLKVMYWSQTSDAICSISFNLMARQYCLEDAHNFDANEHTGDGVQCFFKENLPTDATLQRQTFMIRDFVTITKSGKVNVCDFVRDKTECCLFAVPSRITAFFVHPNKPLICGGCENGRLFIYDYFERTTILEQNVSNILKSKSYEDIAANKTVVHCISYSDCGTHLACAVGDGFLWLLDPIMLKPVEKRFFRPSHAQILYIVFSGISSVLAYYDSFNVVGLNVLTDTWQICGKHRINLKPITTMIFTNDNNFLVTFSEDRYYVEYDVKKSILENTLFLIRSIKVDQSATIQNGILFGKHEQFILTTDDKWKFKVWNAQTLDLLKTFAGPNSEKPIGQLQYKNVDNCEFVAFATQSKTIGLQLIPIDGNPFKCVGMRYMLFLNPSTYINF